MPTPSVPTNLFGVPVTLFDATANQAGVSQMGALFPSTVAITGGTYPKMEAGELSIISLTNGGNVCGAIFSPAPAWEAVLLDFAGVGAAAAKTLTVQIGRLKAQGAVPDVLASAVLTTGSLTLGPTTTNPFTGAGGHSSVTWRFFDATTITTYDQVNSLVQSVSGTAGQGPSQLKLDVHDAAYYFVLVTALDASFSEVLCALTPRS